LSIDTININTQSTCKMQEHGSAYSCFKRHQSLISVPFCWLDQRSKLNVNLASLEPVETS